MIKVDGDGDNDLKDCKTNYTANKSYLGGLIGSFSGSRKGVDPKLRKGNTEGGILSYDSTRLQRGGPAKNKIQGPRWFFALKLLDL